MAETTLLCPSPTWVDTEHAADDAMAEISDGNRVVGYDSEFYGVDIAHESCVGKAVVDVFSMAVPVGPYTSLGVQACKSWVFEGRLLTYEPVRALLENGRITKPVHNQPVDAHAAANQGVCIKGGLNTLSLARFLYPERANLLSGNFDLDSLCRWRLGIGKTEDFKDLFGYKVSEPYQCWVEKNRCLGCGEVGCRKKTGMHQPKERVKAEVTRHKMVTRIVPLSEVRPGHPLFARYLPYAAADAELALLLYQIMLIDGRKERAYPWEIQL